MTEEFHEFYEAYGPLYILWCLTGPKTKAHSLRKDLPLGIKLRPWTTKLLPDDTGNCSFPDAPILVEETTHSIHSPEPVHDIGAHLPDTFADTSDQTSD